ncbi:hypothetical protein PPYR_09989 [Photinus pyralis]|uniref:Transposase domain-containing protein n=1 Tax=Photinus pyralis TaxID=7054 RepID=A0A5N4AFC5_PHOPY|nr:hypothetical protein PPYR_09989 [Photinus pyralis]
MSQRKKKQFISHRQIYRRVNHDMLSIGKESTSFTEQETSVSLSHVEAASYETKSHNHGSESSNLSEDNFSQVDFENDNVDSENEECSFSEAENVQETQSTYISNQNRTDEQCTAPNDSMTLINDLRKWAIHSKVHHSAVNNLLHVLSKYHPNLPLDSRTLLKTSRKLNVKQIGNGELCYLGLKKHLNNFLIKNKDFNLNEIRISFNIDGRVISNIKSDPFVVAVFCGTSKPKPLDAYLEEFIKELEHLLKNGLKYLNLRYTIKIHSFVCDAPAKAFLKCIKNHTGYASCEKCNAVGEYVNGRVILKSTCSPKRTDDSFKLHLDSEHHTGVSPLTKLPIGLVSQFPIDYMHNICLGVMRKLLNFWMSGPLPTRLGSKTINAMSARLESLRNYIPVEFNRKPRSLSELQRWKATEFRSFLLYLGPVVLNNLIDPSLYEQFLLLHSSITILISSKHISNLGTALAKELLILFIQHCESVYGEEFLIYNVHMLCHISDDVDLFGALDNFSAFPFENCLGRLKSLIKSPRKPLQQLCRRLLELEFSFTVQESNPLHSLLVQHDHCNGPLPSDKSINDFKQFKRNADSYCIIGNNAVVQIHNILVNVKNEIFVVGKQFKSKTSLYKYPFESKKLNIFVINNLSNKFEVWSATTLIGKFIVYPVPSKNSTVSFPIIHSLCET